MEPINTETNVNDVNIDLVGDELNKFLESSLIPNHEQIIKEKAYKAYLKHQQYLKTYKEKHKEELSIKAKERYRNNTEFKQKANEKQQNRYFILKYGMAREEYLKVKAEKEQEIINSYIIKIENKKSRVLSYEQFINKYDNKVHVHQPNYIECN